MECTGVHEFMNSASMPLNKTDTPWISLVLRIHSIFLNGNVDQFTEV